MYIKLGRIYKRVPNAKWVRESRCWVTINTDHICWLKTSSRRVEVVPMMGAHDTSHSLVERSVVEVGLSDGSKWVLHMEDADKLSIEAGCSHDNSIGIGFEGAPI